MLNKVGWYKGQILLRTCTAAGHERDAGVCAAVLTAQTRQVDRRGHAPGAGHLAEALQAVLARGYTQHTHGRTDNYNYYNYYYNHYCKCASPFKQNIS